IAALEQRLAAAQTAAASAPPAASNGDGLARAREQVMTLESAISSLRASLRAASDEAAVLGGADESVEVIISSLSLATEELETARDSIRVLTELVD
ncbi:MAG TPA: hypothetical protein VML75_28765, partial [Kofleriaceae bacterium]|nr:hypothetical protein [Kofleriaceae bacterium]